MIAELPPGLLTIAEFARWAGISKSTAYAEIRKKHLAKVKLGRSARIDTREAWRWRDSLSGQRDDG